MLATVPRSSHALLLLAIGVAAAAVSDEEPLVLGPVILGASSGCS